MSCRLGFDCLLNVPVGPVLEGSFVSSSMVMSVAVALRRLSIAQFDPAFFRSAYFISLF